MSSTSPALQEKNEFDEFEFEEMSPIRNVTDLETMYNRNWSTADVG